MSDEKTLGQVRSEAFNTTFAETQCWTEAEAAGIAAVCRAVIDDQIAKHEKECHRLRPPTVKCDDDVAANLSSGSRTLNTGPIIACDVKPEAASEAGDWAYSEITNWHVLNNGVPEIPTRHLQELAAIIREAAERHYGEKIATLERALRLEQELSVSRLQGIEMLTKERDAAREECERLRKLVNHCYVHSGFANCGWSQMDTEMRKLFEATISNPQPAATPATPPAATGEDELRKAIDNLPCIIGGEGRRYVFPDHVLDAIRPLFDAVRAERDRAIEADRTAVKGQLPVVCTKCFYTPGTNRSKYCGDGGDKDNGHRWTKVEELVKRAEAAEAERDKLAAELAEVREAVNWQSKRKIKVTGHMYPDPPHDDIDAILAAYRSTKGKEQADAK